MQQCPSSPEPGTRPGVPAPVLRLDRVALLVIVGLSAAITLIYVHFIAVPYADSRFESHELIVRKEALSPYRYRVLLPWLIHGLASGAAEAGLSSYRAATARLYVLFTAVGLAAGFLVFYRYMRRWFTPESALAATLYLCALAPFTFMYISFQPWAWWELAVYTTGTWLVHQGRRWMFLFLVIVASFLRETAIFLPFLYFLGRLGAERLRPLMLWAGLCGAASAAVFLGLRFALGLAPHVGQDIYPDPLFHRLKYNFTHIMPLVAFVVFYGIFWIYALKGLRGKPRSLTNLLWFVPVFLAVHLFSAHMNESRYYYEIAPIVMPLAFMSVVPWRTEDPGAGFGTSDEGGHGTIPQGGR